MQAQNVPDFSFTDTDGVMHSLSEALAEDKNVILKFFYVECTGCYTSAAELEAIRADYEDFNVEVWAISPYDTDSVLSDFKEEHNLNFAVGGIDGGTWEVYESFVDSFALEFFPTVSVICRDGSVTWDIWPYTPGGAPEWRGAVENCGVYEVTTTSAFSSTAEVKNTIQAEIFPNPVQHRLQIDYSAENARELTAEFYNLQGQKVIEHTFYPGNAGQQSQVLDLPQIMTGQYLLKLSQDGEVKALLRFQKI